MKNLDLKIFFFKKKFPIQQKILVKTLNQLLEIVKNEK